jgi:ABC-2 type transport system permease protein
MLIFKNVFRVVRANLGSYVIYILMPVIFSAIFTFTSDTEPANSYMARGIKIAVDDRDQNALSRAMTDYLLEDNERVECSFEERNLRDDLFYGAVGFALIIPEGYFDTLLSDQTENSVELICGADPDLFGSSSLNDRLDRFSSLAVLHGKGKTDLDWETLASRISEELSVKGDVLMLPGQKDTGTARLSFYYRFAAYGSIAAALHIILQIFKAFRMPEIKLRHSVSASSPLKINTGLMLSSSSILLIVFLLIIIPGFFLFPGQMLTRLNVFLLGNYALVMLFSLALGLFIGSLDIRSETIISALSTGLSLLFAFFGGLFVPIELVGEAVRTFARYLPIYWYNDTIVAIENAVIIDDTLIERILRNAGILTLYTAVLAIAFIAVGRLKQRPEKTLQPSLT